MLEKSLVSVVIPAYNSADYTVETVESVMAQTYRNFEVIVVNDGSTDNTHLVLEPYRGRLQYIYKENGGACSARNVGIRKAKGEYIAFLDCDDLWLPEKLEYSVAKLKSDEQIGFVCTSSFLIDTDGATTGKTLFKVDLQNAYVNLLNENFVVAPTVVMKRECLETVGLFDESIFIPADWDLWLRLAKRFRIGFIDKPLSKYRQSSNYTFRNVDQFISEFNYVLEKHIGSSEDISELQRLQIEKHGKYTCAMAYFKAGQNRNARSMLREVMRIAPGDLKAYFYHTLFYTNPDFFLRTVKLKRCLPWMGRNKTDSRKETQI